MTQEAGLSGIASIIWDEGMKMMIGKLSDGWRFVDQKAGGEIEFMPKFMRQTVIFILVVR